MKKQKVYVVIWELIGRCSGVSAIFYEEKDALNHVAISYPDYVPQHNKDERVVAWMLGDERIRIDGCEIY